MSVHPKADLGNRDSENLQKSWKVDYLELKILQTKLPQIIRGKQMRRFFAMSKSQVMAVTVIEIGHVFFGLSACYPTCPDIQ